MKRLLVITYYWPPSGGAGVQRWLKFVKYLRDFGWEPIVYIPENPEYPETDESLQKDVPPNITILRYPVWEPYEAYKRITGQRKGERINAAFLSESRKKPLLESLSIWIRGNFFIPDARKFWIRPSVRFLNKYLSANPVDALASTGPPHSTHLIAMRLACRYRIPWLADFRDPWTNIDFYQDLKLTRFADMKHRRLEKEVLRKASVVLTISRGMAADFEKIYPRRYEVITNGFDESDLDATTPPALDGKFSIAHIGTLVSTRNPLTLWDALKQLLGEVPGFKEDLEIKLVGKVDFSVKESIEAYGLTPWLKRTEYLPHDQVVNVQRESRILLLIINNTPNAAMILTGKFFEYLAAGRPILCLGPADGDAARILRETGAGSLAGFGEVEIMKEHILAFYRQYKSGLPATGSGDIQKYSRRALTKELATLLDGMAHHP